MSVTLLTEVLLHAKLQNISECAISLCLKVAFLQKNLSKGIVFENIFLSLQCYTKALDMERNDTSTLYRQELKGKILATAMLLFEQKGIKCVKMDDIAKELSISKRTLYELYENKEQLLYEGVRHQYMERSEYLRHFAQQAKNEMEIVMEAIRSNLQYLGHINPQFFLDINKYSRVLDFLQQQHDEQRANSIHFMERGVEHGYFRPDVNYEIVSSMGDAVMTHMMETKMYKKYPMRDIFKNYVNVLLRGLCTEKGLAELSL